MAKKLPAKKKLPLKKKAPVQKKKKPVKPSLAPSPSVTEAVSLDASTEQPATEALHECTEECGNIFDDLIMPIMERVVKAKAEAKILGGTKLTSNSIVDRELIQKTQLVMAYKPEIVKDGNEWMCIIGDLPTGLSAHGKTPSSAVLRMHYLLTEQ